MEQKRDFNYNSCKYFPIVIVADKKEVAEQTLSVRTRKQVDIATLTMADSQNRLQLAVEEKVTI